MPELLPDVDFSKPPEFLEQELATIMSEQTAKGRLSVDKLLKIPMKNGKYEHIFLHVEVQSQRKANFLERTSKYFYRIFDSKGKGVTAFVIYTHDDVPTPHDRYEYKFRGTSLAYEFNSYLVRDADEDELLKSDNVFALVVLACKYVNRTKNDVELRRKFKLKLCRLALERGYSREEIVALLNFIYIVMYLPPEIEQEFDIEIRQEFKQTKMEDYYMLLPKSDDLYKTVEAQVSEKFAEKFATLESKIEEQRKATEEQRKATEEQRKAAEEQKTKMMNMIRSFISSTTMEANEIAEIAGISIEEVLKIKAEIEAQN